MVVSLFFFNDTATTEIYTLSLHDALPIFGDRLGAEDVERRAADLARLERGLEVLVDDERPAGDVDDLHADRKSTRLNSSHANISYAVFCLKKKINNTSAARRRISSIITRK